MAHWCSRRAPCSMRMLLQMLMRVICLVRTPGSRQCGIGWWSGVERCPMGVEREHSYRRCVDWLHYYHCRLGFFFALRTPSDGIWMSLDGAHTLWICFTLSPMDFSVLSVHFSYSRSVIHDTLRPITTHFLFTFALPFFSSLVPHVVVVAYLREAYAFPGSHDNSLPTVSTNAESLKPLFPYLSVCPCVSIWPSGWTPRLL